MGGLLLLGLGLAAGLTVGGRLGLLAGLALGIPGYLLIGRGFAGSWQSVAPPTKSILARLVRRNTHSAAARHRSRPAAPTLRGSDVRELLSLLALLGGIALWVVVGGWAGAGLFVLSLLVLFGIMIWGFGKGDMP